MQSIIVCSRAWSSPNDGQAIHSSFVFLNGERVDYYRNEKYADTHSVEEAAIDRLISKGKLPERRMQYDEMGKHIRTETNWDYCERNGIHIESVISWVGRRKDL